MVNGTAAIRAAIAYTMRFQLGLVLVAWALFVAGRLAAISTGLLGVLFTIVAGGTVAAFAIRWSMAPANAEVKASARELEETVARAKDVVRTATEAAAAAEVKASLEETVDRVKDVVRTATEAAAAAARGMTKAREAAADEHSGERPAKSDNPRQQP